MSLQPLPDVIVLALKILGRLLDSSGHRRLLQMYCVPQVWNSMVVGGCLMDPPYRWNPVCMRLAPP
jgi:hypothetical protein